MIIKIEKRGLTAEELNNLYREGYRYYAEGDYRELETEDPWSGMPNTTNNIYAFSDKEEAETFAVKQDWVFNKNIHAKVETIPPHSETWEEKEARWEKEKAEAKAKREAKEAKKAEEAGLSLEAYKAEKKRLASIRKISHEIEELKAELAKKEAYLKKLEKKKN